jgi:hypothetical protein
VKTPTATDPSTGTTREQSCGHATFLELLLGREGIASAIFPSEETKLEREKLIASIVAAREADAECWQRAAAGTRVLQQD